VRETDLYVPGIRVLGSPLYVASEEAEVVIFPTRYPLDKVEHILRRDAQRRRKRLVALTGRPHRTLFYRAAGGLICVPHVSLRLLQLLFSPSSNVIYAFARGRVMDMNIS
jgi:hypothetical protein